MTRDELIDRLQKYEWSDVEFKEAARAAPRDSYTTVSAFANTSGGWLVFGVRDHGGSFEIVGVIEVDKVQNEFLSTLRSRQKVNRAISVSGEVIETGEETLLVFHVPESPRSEKPVYLDGDIRRSFIRRGGCDERCTPAEIERFLRDASDARYDGQLLETLDAEEFFDPASVRWYRRAFDERNPGRDQTLSDLEFLDELAFVVEHGDRLVPTRAAVLVFGRSRHVRRILPRMVVDFQIVESDFDSWSSEQRWSDRIEIEENLIQAWLRMSERYMKHAERPFSVNATTLRRDDDPPDYISFREAAINLLLHQDYGDHGRWASIRLFRDRTVFSNPGDAFAATDELLDPTAKEIRNSSIVAAFRRIGLSEQAGTGVRAIFRNWQRLGHVPPVIDNDKEKKSFTLCLVREELLGEEQRLFQAQLGVRLDDAQARLFAFACRNGGASSTDAKAITGRSGPEARKVLDTLVVQGLLRPLGEGYRYGLAEHLVDDRLDSAQLGQSGSDQVAEGSGNLVTDQPGSPAGYLVTPLLTNLTDIQRKVIQLCEVARKQADLMREMGFTHRTFFRRTHLEPLIRARLIRMTHPDEPNHPDQAYVVTEAGSGLLDAWQTVSGGEPGT